MNGLATLLAHDLRLQYRYGIHAAYGAVVALYAAILVLAGPYIPDWFVGLLIYSDPSALGFFFLGGLMLLEKGEGVRSALAIAPVSARTYLLAKTITLTTLALAAVIVLALARAHPTDWAILISTVALTSVFYVGIGIPIALRFKTVNAYLLGSALLLAPALISAGFAFLNPPPLVLTLLPPVAQLRLTLVALGYGTAGILDLAVMFSSAFIAAATACCFAHRALKIELGIK
ncbi:hypothetical protein [Pelagibacterium sp.]|uniref:hypothetical protein n=1 Tax=Pelagibacterium sp. TaxID=1967288 RepID=UPI003A90D54E